MDLLVTGYFDAGRSATAVRPSRLRSAASAYPFGRLADRLDRTMLLVLGITFLIAAERCWRRLLQTWQVAFGVILWGLHMGTTQGLLTTLIVDVAPTNLRGTALGIYNLIAGIGLLAASLLAGSLWAEFGPAATFVAGGAFAGAALLGMLSLRSGMFQRSPTK